MSRRQVAPTDGVDGVVSVLGWSVLVGLVGMLWIAQAKPSQSQAQGQGQVPAAILAEQPQVLTTPLVSDTPRILKFDLSLNGPDDLQVRQGDFVNAGQVIADRSRQRQRLISQRDRAKLSLQKIESRQVIEPAPPAPVPPIRALPPLSFQSEEATITKVQADIDLQTRKLDLLQTLPPDQVPPAMREHEDRRLEKLYAELKLAQGALRKAQDGRQYQEYEHSLAMARRAEQENQQKLAYEDQRQRVEQQRRDREFQIAQLEANVKNLDREIAELSTVTSPYAGTIRRVKWLGQSDNKLKVEITLAVGAPPGAGNLPGLDFSGSQ